MEEMYGLQSTAEYSDKALMSPENLILPPDYQTLLASSGDFRDRIPVFGSNELLSAAASAISEAEAASITPEIQREDDFINVIKAKISSHPSYPRLLHAYIDCQKVNTALSLNSQPHTKRRKKRKESGPLSLFFYTATFIKS